MSSKRNQSSTSKTDATTSKGVKLSTASDFVKKCFATLDSRAAVQVDPSKSIKLYVRSAELMYKQGIIYASENDLEKGYILLMKYCLLGITELPKHPEYSQPSYETEMKTLKMNIADSLDKMEVLKPKLIAYYQQLEARLKEQEAARVKAEQEAVIKTQRKGNSSEKLPSHHQTVSSGEDSRKESLVPVSQNPNWWMASQQYVPKDNANAGTLTVSASQTSITPLYPLQQTIPPPVASSVQPLPPPIPARVQWPEVDDVKNMVVPNDSSNIPPPIPQRPSDPASLSHTDGFGEFGGSGLRRMNLPSSTMSKFLKIAESNTKKGLETCGILGGALKNNQLHVTTLIIPKQSATANSCQTIDEMELFTYQDSNNLLTFGWIHTHPTQTCFMSSVDLHTHCPYQLMLPEAIAIVLAPSKTPSQGIFQLTDPTGLDIVTKCRHPDMFHPHQRSDDELYSRVDGHVFLTDDTISVVDLR